MTEAQMWERHDLLSLTRTFVTQQQSQIQTQMLCTYARTVEDKHHYVEKGRTRRLSYTLKPHCEAL